MKKLLLVSCLILSTVVLFSKNSAEAKNFDDGVITLNLWDIMVTDDEARVIKPTIDKWNKNNPGVQIVRDSLDDDSYKTKIKTAIAANEAPDLFFTWGGGFSAPFVDSGKVLNLDSYISKEFKSKALEGSLSYCTYNDNLYGLPYGMWVGVLYCNQEMFDNLGLEIPETFEELLDVAKVFKDNGVGAIGVGAAEKWVGMFYHNIIAERTAGAKLTNLALSGLAPYDSPEFVEAAEKLEALVNADVFNNGYMGMDYEGAQNMFLQGEIPMFFQGDWVSGDCELDDSPVKGKIVVKHFPYIKGHEEFKYDFLGGSVDSFMISANTKYPKEATEFLQFLVEELSTEGAKEGINLPVYKADIDLTSVNRVTRQIIDLTKDATGFTLAWDTFLVGEDAELHLDLVQEMFAGMITPEEFSSKMQTINQ
ncbi:extracellular solute-binding protein [Thiospirochaeta perfilievii]|uniref:Extracellular solute-binding protein n=1 Tax=Thiospirochaeta perfilievii TaxID=252967 RepID=A0A5C1QE39_9SPIO|nr:extracellular solute-binding protein [Thiospirochaeta perfilievii]QEN04916.1 extracellular solute-binding protein [Thiospirochaeta perfilievii]